MSRIILDGIENKLRVEELQSALTEAERERVELTALLHEIRRERDALQADLTEARAANAAAWEGAYNWGYNDGAAGAPCDPDPDEDDATEALRRVKASVWEEGWASHGRTSGSTTCEPNPYATEAEA